MSLQAAQAFRQQANASPALQSQVAGFFQNGNIDYEGLAALARSHGHEVTTEDAIAALSGADDELSDFEMELVAGGTSSQIRGPSDAMYGSRKGG